MSSMDLAILLTHLNEVCNSIDSVHLIQEHVRYKRYSHYMCGIYNNITVYKINTNMYDNYWARRSITIILLS